MASARIWAIGAVLVGVVGLVELAPGVRPPSQPPAPAPVTIPTGSDMLVGALDNRDLSKAMGLIAGGASVGTRSHTGDTSLGLAAAAGKRDFVALCLSRGADVNARAEDGRTPLILAVQYNHPEVVEILLRANARTDLKTNGGETALSIARKEKYQALVARLNQR